MGNTYFKVKREWYSKHFINYLEYEGKYAFLVGSRGSSKSHHVFLKHFAETFKPRYTNIYYCRHDETTIRGTTFKDMILFLELTGLSDLFEYSNAANSSMIFKNKVTGWTISPKGLHDISKIKGMPQPTHILIDELDQTTFEAWAACNAVLRTPKAEVLQLTAMLNPVSEKNWVCKTFFDEKDPYQIKEFIQIGEEKIPFRESVYLNFSNLYHNEYIDHEEYRQRIIINSNGDPARLECDLYGRWGNVKVGNLFIYALNKSRHIAKELPLRETVRQWVSVDFNTDPMTAIIAQVGYCHNLKTDYIEIIDEIVLRGKNGEGAGVYELCDRIKDEYDVEWLDFVGDAQGWARNVNSRGAKSSWKIINEELNLTKSQNKTPKGKKAIIGKSYVNDKRQLVNYFLQTHPRFLIDSRCVNLIEDIETVQATEDGKMPKKNNKDKTHLLDCLCDLIITLVRYKILEIDLKILGGKNAHS